MTNSDPSMETMLNEIKIACAINPEWTAHVAQAERLYEGNDRFGLTTLYYMMCRDGYLPWTPENVASLTEQRAGSRGTDQ